MKHRARDRDVLRGGHLNNLGVLAFFAFMAFETTSPASAEAMFMGLGDLPGGEFSSAARAVSADGSIVVGFSDDGDAMDGEKAFRWENGVMTALDGPLCETADGAPVACRSVAADSSADGSVIVEEMPS